MSKRSAWSRSSIAAPSSPTSCGSVPPDMMTGPSATGPSMWTSGQALRSAERAPNQ